MEIGPENLLDYASQGQRFESGNVNQPRRKVAVSPRLECPFCKNVSYAKSYFLTKPLREKHNYRLSLDEERMANETLEQAKMETDLTVRMKRSGMRDETFSGEDEQVMTNESTEADNHLSTFRGRRKNTDEIERGIAAKRRKINHTDQKLKMRPVVKLKRLKPKEKKIRWKTDKWQPSSSNRKVRFEENSLFCTYWTETKTRRETIKIKTSCKNWKIKLSENPLLQKAATGRAEKDTKSGWKTGNGQPVSRIRKVRLE